MDDRTMVQVQDELLSAGVSRRASGTHLSRLAATATEFGRTEEVDSAAVESMLLGLQFRGWLADREKEFLDNLAPDRSITFLIRGKQYLHPEGIELFPSRLIETAIRQGGEALFSHRYRPERCEADGYIIHTALINPSEPEPLVLGYFGPDRQLGQPGIQDRFYRRVSQFRETYRLVGEIAHDLAGVQKSDTPTIIVNRCSGRVVSINEAAEKLFRTPRRSLVDLEFGELKSRFVSLSPGRKMKLTNLSKGRLYLTIITMPHTETPSRSQRSGVPEPFVDRIRRMSGNLAQAAEKLDMSSREATDADVIELSHMVAEAAGKLDLCVTKLHFLVNFESLAPCRIDLQEELKQAVQAVAPKPGQKPTIEIADKAVDLKVQAPRDAFRYLFESVLLSHLSEMDTPGRTNISLKRQPTDGQPIITIETDTHATSVESALSGEWRSYAGKLAARMDVELVDKHSAQDHKLITRITVNR